MRLPKARISIASAVALTMGIGVPAVMASTASAATTSGSAVQAAAKSSPGSITAPVTGTFTNAAGTGTFSGTFTPTRFHVVHGVLEASGRLTGTLTSADGTSLGSVSRAVTLPVSMPGAAAPGAAADPPACNILNLVLGPLNLNLLGLVVTLNQVNLNITAVPGAGALLGNLLCAVANLLNGGGTGVLSQISTLLNEILSLL